MTNKSEPMEFRFTGEVQRMTLNPGDVLVLKVPDPISDEQAKHLREAIEREFVGHKALVLGHGLDVSVMERPAWPSGVTVEHIEMNAEQMRREFGVVNNFHIGAPADKRSQAQIAAAATCGLRAATRA